MFTVCGMWREKWRSEHHQAADNIPDCVSTLINAKPLDGVSIFVSVTNPWYCKEDHGTISSCICGDRNTDFKPKYHLFLTLTKCLNLCCHNIQWKLQTYWNVMFANIYSADWTVWWLNVTDSLCSPNLAFCTLYHLFSTCGSGPTNGIPGLPDGW